MQCNVVRPQPMYALHRITGRAPQYLKPCPTLLVDKAFLFEPFFCTFLSKKKRYLILNGGNFDQNKLGFILAWKQKPATSKAIHGS